MNTLTFRLVVNALDSTIASMMPNNVLTIDRLRQHVRPCEEPSHRGYFVIPLESMLGQFSNQVSDTVLGDPQRSPTEFCEGLSE